MIKIAVMQINFRHVLILVRLRSILRDVYCADPFNLRNERVTLKLVQCYGAQFNMSVIWMIRNEVSEGCFKDMSAHLHILIRSRILTRNRL